MGRITDLLNNYDIYSGNTDLLYDIFKSVNVFEIPIVNYCINPGAILVRQRVNISHKEFFKVADLSYPPSMNLSKHGRANIPYQSMFYACSFPMHSSDKEPYPRIVSLLETSAFFRDKTTKGIERSTISRWDVINKINLIALPFSGLYKCPCLDILYIKKLWTELIANNNINSDGLELIQYMADEISKEFTSDKEYVKIANFVNYLLHINEKTKDADGIIYPSVHAQGAGFNVSIKPHIADKKLSFAGASLCHLLKQQDKSYIAIMNHSLQNSNGTITYVKKQFDNQEQAVYSDYSYGLSFVN